MQGGVAVARIDRRGLGLRGRRLRLRGLRRERCKARQQQHQRAHRSGAAPAALEGAREPERGKGVGDEQREGEAHQGWAQIQRGGFLQGVHQELQSREIDRVQLGVERERVHRRERIRRAIEARGMLGAGAPRIIDRNGPGGKRRRAQHAKAIEGARGGDALDPLGGGVGGIARRSAGPAFGGDGDGAAQEIDEEAGERQVRPGRVRRHMHQHDHALAAPPCGDERRAIGQRGPGLGGQARLGLGQHLTGHGDLIRYAKAIEGAFALEGGEALGGVPREGAAEHAPAAPQPHGRQIIGRGRQPCARKAQQHAALFHEFDEPIPRRAGDDAHIGQRQHGHAIVEHGEDGIALARARLAHFRERRQGPHEIVGGREQGLRGVGAGAGHHAHAPTLPAFIQQGHRPRRMFIDQLDPRDLVAQLHGQIEASLHVPRRAQIKARIADGDALHVQRPQQAL